MAAGLLVAAAPAALSEGESQTGQGERTTRVVLRDRSGDVHRMVPPDTSSYPFGEFPAADVTRAVVTHRPAAVVVLMRFVDLQRLGTQLYWVDFRTPDLQYRARLQSEPGARQGRKTFEEQGVVTRCSGFTRRIDFARDVVRMRVPRACLGDPDWVRVELLNTLEVGDKGLLYIDDPHSNVAMGGPTRRIYRMQPSRIVLRDGSDDVWQRTGPEEETRVGEFPAADIRRAVVVHDLYALRVRMRFADLKRVGYGSYWFNLKTPRHYYQAGVFTEPGKRQGRLYFQGDDGSRSCEGFTRRVDYDKDVVTMRIPRSCLQRPRWIRIGLLHQLALDSPEVDPYYDKTGWGESKRIYHRVR
jgi:hypothetical protein